MGEGQAVVFGADRLGPGLDREALGREYPAEQLARLGLLDRQQAVQGLDHGDGGAEAGKDLGELQSDRATAEHQK
jgi:hypothetical protein